MKIMETVGTDTTQYTDTVSFLHKYTYKVRAYDNAGHYSAWSNTVKFASRMLAQPSYPKMSAYNNAYNNGTKKAKYGNDEYRPASVRSSLAY